MSLTIRVIEHVDVECIKCGDTLDCYTNLAGVHQVSPCKRCLREQWYEAYDAGKEEAESRYV